ncbi:MAG: hypothetical protein M5U01_27115 [Ardenticatenaceae bacterium]|nr:hypothetical protein [Ardenticatenaceae bacterium]
MKKLGTTTVLAALVAVLVLGVAGVGAVAAAGPGGPRGHGAPIAGLKKVADLLGMTPREMLQGLCDNKTIADLASEKNVSTDAVVDAIVAGREARTAEWVKSGLLTQAQADAINARGRTRAEDIVTLPLPYGMFGEGLKTAAGTIGISVDDLIGELEAGKSVAEVAAANGKTAQAVVDALVAAKEQSFQELISLDLMTRTQANLGLARYRETAERMVNEVHTGQGQGICRRVGRGPGASFAPRSGFGGRPLELGQGLSQ